MLGEIPKKNYKELLRMIADKKAELLEEHKRKTCLD